MYIYWSGNVIGSLCYELIVEVLSTNKVIW